MRLQPGTLAPDFDVVDALNTPVRLGDYRGRHLMLSFYRFASCPLCNLRVHRLVQLQPRFAACGLEMVAVFQSSPEVTHAHVGKQDAPFPIVADPERKLYEAYRIESSRAAVMRAAVRRLGDAAVAMAKGFIPSDIDGDTRSIPADFVIDDEGVIRIAYYGRDIGDHLAIDRIESFLSVAPHSTIMQALSPLNP